MSAGKDCWPFDCWPDDDEFASLEECNAFWGAVKDLEYRGDLTGLVTYLREHAPLPKGVARALARLISGEHLFAADEIGRYALRPTKVVKQGSKDKDPTLYRRKAQAARLIHDLVEKGEKFQRALEAAADKYDLGTKSLQEAVRSFEETFETKIPRSKRGRPPKPRAESEP